MSVPVPGVVARYFEATDSGEKDALVACFTEDAVVVDEGRTWRGLAEIRQWRDEVATAYEYTVEILGAEPAGVDEYLVTARLEGNFPGNVVDLGFRFGLRDDLIDRLRIAP
ncbi:nuclear transport factor 2 family protein [Micromonospora sp. NBC_01796]|uniref:nuclear transport factor 2 family protein n=1 Tax=Micromonospora sp. NBC_01796 TaxID=2975987 RepID=UPI002DDBD94B|nr:nuclear transport factor 2 family protein [Micromonospora sp. NBC_01796]WSA83723.1 nuclear transport factor 2 family protein [Micromonospora sp. NBC_01796]